MKVITKQEIKNKLKSAGLTEKDTVIVHTSLSSIGYVCGGAQAIIEALIETVGNDGTIVMPAQSWKNLDPETGVHWTADESDWQIIRDNWPAFDKNITPTNTMGAVAEMFRLWPGTKRSNHPARSVCAWGKYSDYIVCEHSLSNIFGEGSPIGKLYELNAKVLLIGVGYDKNTSLHLADVRAEYPSKRNCIEHSAVLENGKRVWKEYETLSVDGEDFTELGNAFEKNCPFTKETLGNAEIKLMNQRILVDFAVNWIQIHRK